MACQLCRYKRLQNIGVCHPPYDGVPIFWCSRCGTLRANIVTEQDEVPKWIRDIEAQDGISVAESWREYYADDTPPSEDQ